jgi:hypothetical protein
VCADCNAYGKESFSSRLVSEEAIIINKEETGSLKGKERLLTVEACTHTHQLHNSNRGFLRKIYFSTNYTVVRERRIVEQNIFWNNADNTVNQHVNVNI